MPMKGRQAHITRLKKLGGPTMERRIGLALFAGGELIATEAQISITTDSASGRRTKKHAHTPSLPGQPPNNDTGHLANNIEAVSKAPLVVEVSSNASYSKALEFGTSRMAARPFMAPARDAKRKEVVDLVERAVQSVVKGSRSR